MNRGHTSSHWRRPSSPDGLRDVTGAVREKDSFDLCGIQTNALGAKRNWNRWRTAIHFFRFFSRQHFFGTRESAALEPFFAATFSNEKKVAPPSAFNDEYWDKYWQTTRKTPRGKTDDRSTFFSARCIFQPPLTPVKERRNPFVRRSSTPRWNCSTRNP